MELENTGAEVQEVAAPANEGVEVQEVAEPVETPQETAQSGKTEADAAFAEYRRAKEAAEQRAADAERELAEIKAMNEARQEAIRRLTGTEDGEISAIAEAYGVEVADISATFAANAEAAKKDLRIQELEKEIAETKADQQLQADLIEVQKIDPEIKSLYELGETFLTLKVAGVDTESAYWAAKAKKEATEMKAPKPPGKAGSDEPEKTYFTEAEVDAMTPAQQRANKDKILASMPRWG